MRRVAAGLVTGMALVVWCGVAAADTAKAPDGKPVFLKYKCTSCHSIASQKIESKKAAEESAEATDKAAGSEGEKASKVKPPDLSGVGVDHTSEWIALFLVKKEKVEGETHPKKFRGTDTERTTLSAWLATMKDEAAAKKAAADLKKSASAATPAPAPESKTAK